MTERLEVSLDAGLKIGFGMVLLLLIGMTVTGLARMASIDRFMDQVVKENSVKDELAHHMKDAVNDRITIMHSIFMITDEFDRQDEFNRFSQDAADFTNARDRLLKMKLNPAEEKILADIRQIAINTQPLVARAIDQAMHGENDAAHALIATDIVSRQRQIISAIDRLIELQDRETDQAVQKVSETYANTYLLMSLFGVVAATLCLIIAVVVIRHTNRLARSLHHQAMFDGLTDLPNRTLFADRLKQAILIGRREKRIFGLIAMDLD
ncbi:MAG: MCP four helix bundle domain-containing protein, partial [Sulfuricaulis sp.]